MRDFYSVPVNSAAPPSSEETAPGRAPGFAHLTGVTARQVNNWCRGRAAVPRWVAIVAVTLQDLSASELEMRLEEAAFDWSETLGISPRSAPEAIRAAMAAIARRYYPDVGGTPEQMIRVNQAYEAGRGAPAGHRRST